MKMLGAFLIFLSGAAGLLAISVIDSASDAGVGTVVGALAIPALLAWWGILSLKRQKSSLINSESPTPNTHVRCPECRELVRVDAKLCKHCHTKLIPGEFHSIGNDAL